MSVVSRLPPYNAKFLVKFQRLTLDANQERTQFYASVCATREKAWPSELCDTMFVK